MSPHSHKKKRTLNFRKVRGTSNVGSRLAATSQALVFYKGKRDVKRRVAACCDLPGVGIVHPGDGIIPPGVSILPPGGRCR